MVTEEIKKERRISPRRRLRRWPGGKKNHSYFIQHKEKKKYWKKDKGL